MAQAGPVLAWLTTPEADRAVTAVWASGSGLPPLRRAADWPAVLQALATHPADLLLCDEPVVTLPAQLREAGHEVPVVLVRSADEAAAAAALAAGAADCVAPDQTQRLAAVVSRETTRAAACRAAQAELEFQRAILDSSTTCLAVVDASGLIVQVNAAWRALSTAAGTCEGANYLAICDEAEGPEAAEAQQIANLLRQVLAGERLAADFEYACHTPTQQRWFVGRIARLPGDGPPRAVVAHHDVTGRRAAAEALARSERLHRDLLANAAEAIYVIQDGCLQFVSRSCADLFALPAETMLGRPATDFVAPGWERTTPAFEQQVLATAGPVSGECEVETPRGRRWLRLNAVRIDWAGRPAALFCASDVTAERQAIAALQASQARWQSLFDDAAIPVWEEDFSAVRQLVVSLRAAGVNDLERYLLQHRDDLLACAAAVRVVAVNQASLDFFGVDSREALLVALPAYFTEEAWRCFAGEIAALAGGASRFEGEFRIRDQFGRVRLVALRLAVPPESWESWERVLVSWIDLTARDEAEAALRQSEERFRLLFDQAPLGVTWTGLDLCLLRVNAEFCRFLGRSAMELCGCHITSLTHPEDTQLHEEGVARLLRGEIDLFETDKRYLRPDGSPVWGHLRVRVLRDLAGQPQALLSTVEDITERRSLAAQLQEAQRVEALGRLAGGVAHDLNNLLTPILGYGQLLQHDLPLGDPRLADLRDVVQAAEGARDLTRQLLAFGRQQVLHLQPLDLAALVRQFQPLLRRALHADVELVLDLPPQLPAVLADARQMEQVLMNLLLNAQDALPQGGRIQILGRCRSEAVGHIAEWVELRVEDNGVGMDSATVARAFEPFFTTKPQGQGTGLGLSSCHGIVTQHGGQISVTSTLGEGTQITVRLPQAAALPPPAPPPPPAIESQPNRLRVLVVDDDAAVVRLTARALRQAGHEVLTAIGPEPALEQLRDLAAPIDLLLTDVVMPGLSGRQLFEQARGLRPALRALFMSAHSAEVVTRRGVPQEPFQFIAKPFDVPTMLRAVDAAMRG